MQALGSPGFLGFLGFLILAAVWFALTGLGRHLGLPPSVAPSPPEAVAALLEEVRSGRLTVDVASSLSRWALGFGGACLIGIPAGLLLSASTRIHRSALPLLNFLRNISIIAWIPFAVLWFGVGSAPVVFLIFLSAVLPLALACAAAAASVPETYLRLARETGLSPATTLARITLPASAPSLLTAMRLCAGISWTTLVAAEMIAGRDGLGFAVHDARNGMRTDTLCAIMGVIGAIGVGTDGLLRRLSRHKRMAWAYHDDLA